MFQELVGPGDEVLPIRTIGVAAVVLTPGELTIEQADVHGRHLLGLVVVRHTKTLRAEQAEDRLRRDGCHIAALVIEPLRIAALRDAVADERQPRRAQRDQFMGIDGDVAGGFSTERRFLGAVLQEVSRHPVIFAGAGEVLDRFAPVPSVQLGAALT